MNPQQMEMLAALKNHRMDGLRMLRVTREQAEILKDPCSEILITGSNRGGKTLLAAARFASIVRDIPIITVDGESIDCRLPHQKGRALLTWVIGDHLKHIGQTLYRVLFKPGLFQMVKDSRTGWWRAWNPLMYPEDRTCPRSERKPAPPLIPGFSIERDIDPASDILDAAWYHANLYQFESITLKNGTQIMAYANSSEVKQGDPVDEIWMDENLVYDEYYDEYVMRLLDNAGRMCWSTIARDESAAFCQVDDRATAQEEEVARGEREPRDVTTRCHRVTLAKNPFIAEDEKAKAAERMSGERANLVRIQGLRSDRVIAVYSEFSSEFHCVRYPNESQNDEVTRILEANNWEPPSTWTRELILDPGTIKPAVLFGTVPPPELWDHNEPYFILYKEIFIRRLDAYQIAAKIVEMEHDPMFNRMIIDGQAAQQKPMGFSWSVGRQYELAFEQKKIISITSGGVTHFIPGDPDFQARSTRVRAALRMRQCGRPQLRIITQRCPETVKQMLRNRRKTDNAGNPLEEPADKQVDDLRVCVEYWLSRQPTYVKPPESASAIVDPGTRAWRERMEAFGSRRQDQSVPIGITT